MDRDVSGTGVATPVRVEVDGAVLEADLEIPAGGAGIVLFAHGSGSGRASPRNRAVAAALREGGLGTLLVDLLTADEAAVDLSDQRYRFDIDLLGERVIGTVDWLAADARTAGLAVGCYGASTGAAAALMAAAARPERIAAVVSRGGRPDLAGDALERVKAPTLFIVGGRDVPVLALNREAMARMPGVVALEIVPGAGHLFEEPGALQAVAGLARDWFVRHLAGGSPGTP